MKSPRDRYEQDAAYHQAVDMMEAMIHQGHFTPSEMREMSVLASIHYELKYGFRHYHAVPISVNQALEELQKYRRDLDEETRRERAVQEICGPEKLVCAAEGPHDWLELSRAQAEALGEPRATEICRRCRRLRH